MGNLNFNFNAQAQLNDIFPKFRKEFDLLPSFDALMLERYGCGYGEIESLLLYCFVRHLHPRTVIEVGSGVSTVFFSKAITVNQKDGWNTRLICIEPYPHPKLKEIPLVQEIIIRKVQDIPVEFFQQLGEGDILFIDSSHTVKIGSDVNYLILDIIPSLKKGVIVHFHDIPFPYVFPYPDFWIFDRLMFWQEPVLLKAFLTNNNAFEIVYCSSYLHFKNNEVLKKIFPLYDKMKHFPSSIWIRKTS